MKKHYKSLTRLSNAFALMTDFALLSMGGALKRKEYISGRFADALAGLYMASATLKRFHDEGQPKKHEAMVDHALRQQLHDIESALGGIIRNMPSRTAAWVACALTFPFGPRHCNPLDKHRDKVAEAVLNADIRADLTPSVFIPKADEKGMGALVHTAALMREVKPLRQAVADARRDGHISKDIPLEMAKAAREKGILSDSDLAKLEKAYAAMDDLVQVDDFTPTQAASLK